MICMKNSTDLLPMYTTSQDITSIIKQMLLSISEPCSIYQNINPVSIVANVYDKPRYYIHYKANAPLNIRALFYIPEYKPSEYLLPMYTTSQDITSIIKQMLLSISEPCSIYQNINLVSIVANVYNKLRYYIHYKADAPLNIRALFLYTRI